MSPLTIFSDIIAPIVVLLGIGFALDRAFHLDITTLTRVGFYVFTPAIAFATIVESSLTAADIATVAGFAAAHMLIMALLAAGLFSLRPFVEKRTVLGFGAVFFNAGNYGFPLMLLAFGEWAVGVIAIVLLVQTILMYTLGLFALIGDEEGLRGSIIRLLKMPVLYAVALGFVLRAFDLELIPALAMPLERLAQAFVPMALITTGAQLSQSDFRGDVPEVSAIVLVRLIASPLIAAALAVALGVPARMAPVLIVGAGLPVAVNVFV
ncbi:MAG TPA: AEC family transporter, partial [Aggregatilineales bacterium]|nr:AEC family transporter [Aggregatilineales bacterium]